MKNLIPMHCPALAGPVGAQKFEGLAPTPPMGWNTWNTFACDINEALVHETAEAMIANGMRDAGLCKTGTANAQEAYQTMRDALHVAGRPIVFSLCEWGTAGGQGRPADGVRIPFKPNADKVSVGMLWDGILAGQRERNNISHKPSA